MKRQTFQLILLTLVPAIWLAVNCWAQVNSGSTGSDGALNVPSNSGVTINMADHPTGIYNYTSVTIGSGASVGFTPNANNTPVVWLVQGNVTIAGSVSVVGQGDINSTGGLGGPGGYRGGNGVNGTIGSATAGEGPGGGPTGPSGGSASYGTIGCTNNGVPPSPVTYGNIFLLPLLGGSGGGGTTNGCGLGGGGGGGAILIAASGTITVNGSILATGGSGSYNCYPSQTPGGGSGGSVRLLASSVLGGGQINAGGGSSCGGNGRVRFDTYENDFSGSIQGVFSQGSQFVVIPTAGQGAQLAIASVAGVPVSASPTGLIATPDAVVSAQQGNPIAIVVQCTNIPLNTPITVSVTPMNGSPVSGTGFNTTGTQASSTATVTLTLPRGGGLIYATAATGN